MHYILLVRFCCENNQSTLRPFAMSNMTIVQASFNLVTITFESWTPYRCQEQYTCLLSPVSITKLYTRIGQRAPLLVKQIQFVLIKSLMVCLMLGNTCFPILESLSNSEISSDLFYIILSSRIRGVHVFGLYRHLPSLLFTKI